MTPDPRIKTASPAFQRRLSLFLIALLVTIGGVILWIQNQFDPGSWHQVAGHSSPSLETPAEAPQGLVPLSATEKYNADTLSDKIDGKADLYLSAGFQSLESRRFALTSDNRYWLERYVYDMGGHLNAYAVYSAQLRNDIQPSSLTTDAYVSANGLFLVHGPYYVEIIASETSEALQARMADLGAAFVASHAVRSGTIPELGLFPADHQVPHTTKLIADSAFGIQDLNRIFAATYAEDQAEAIAFVSRRASSEEARALADTFVAYWEEYGGQMTQTPDHAKGARIVFILDNYEIAMVQGDYFFGVHEAMRLEMGLSLVAKLQQAIGKIDQ